MSIYDKINKMLGIESPEEKLYKVLNTDEYKIRPYEYTDLGEGMAVIGETMWGWWKHRFLIKVVLDDSSNGAISWNSPSIHILQVKNLCKYSE